MTSGSRRQRHAYCGWVTGPTLSARQLNRTVLARQHLLSRAGIDIPTALQHVGGLQTQYAPSGYVGLWSRLVDFERDALTRALDDRSVVQATLMRCTIHMVSAADFWLICAGVRTSRREWWVRTAKSRKLTDIPHQALTEVLRAELADGPRSSAELIAAMGRAGFAKPLWEGAGLWLDMVRVPPSGTWERRRADRYGLAEQWITVTGEGTGEVSEEAGLRLLLIRYLGAFGPAALADAANWAGVPRTRLQPVVATMDLRTFRDEERHGPGRSGRRSDSGSRHAGAGPVPADVGCHLAGPLPPFRHPARTVPPSDLPHAKPPVGRNRPGRRCGRGDVGVAQQPGRGR